MPVDDDRHEGYGSDALTTGYAGTSDGYDGISAKYTGPGSTYSQASGGGSRKYGNPLYGWVSPYTMHEAAEGAHGAADVLGQTARVSYGLSRLGGTGYVSQAARGISSAFGIGGAGGGGAGGGGGAAGTGGGGGMGGMRGISAGFEVAKLGTEALAEETGNIMAEDAAANATGDAGGNAESYLRAQQHEYGGATGLARYGVQSLESHLPTWLPKWTGAGSEAPAQQMQELAQAAEQDKEVQQRVAEAKKDAARHKELEDRERHQAEEAKEAQAPDAATRQTLHADFEQQQTDRKADDIDDNWQKYTADHSQKGFQKLKAETDQMRAEAATQRDAVLARDAKEQGQRVASLTSEAKADQLETSGDVAGARRERLEGRLGREQAAADLRSPAEGRAFREQVAPAERAKLQADDENRRVADAAEAAEKIQAIDARANDARERSAGDTFKAERDQRFAAIDQETARLQQQADQEPDVAKKAQAQKLADAARASADVRKLADDDHHVAQADRPAREAAFAAIDAPVEALRKAADAATDPVKRSDLQNQAARAAADTVKRKLQYDDQQADGAADRAAYQADRTAKFAEIDRPAEELQRRADAERDNEKRPLLQREATAAKSAASAEEQAYDDDHGREDREAADQTRQGTAAEGLRGAGLGAEAEELQQLARDAQEARQAEREGRPQDAQAIRDRARYDKDEGDYRRDQEAHRRDVRAEDAHYRASGQGAQAEYNDFREQVASEIREAERTHDPKRIDQAKRTAADELKGYELEHRDKAQMYGSDEEYANHLLVGDVNGNGQAAMFARNAQDQKALNGGKGDLPAGEISGAKLDAAATKLGAAVEKWEKVLEDAAKISVVGS
jgi:hypothetical protein